MEMGLWTAGRRVRKTKKSVWSFMCLSMGLCQYEVSQSKTRLKIALTTFSSLDMWRRVCRNFYFHWLEFYRRCVWWRDGGCRQFYYGLQIHVHSMSIKIEFFFKFSEANRHVWVVVLSYADWISHLMFWLYRVWFFCIWCINRLYFMSVILHPRCVIPDRNLIPSSLIYRTNVIWKIILALCWRIGIMFVT